MDYTERIELVENTIQEFCRKYISENYANLERIFLQKIDIQLAYKEAFIQQFEEYCTKDIEVLLWISSENLVYSFSAFLRTNPTASLGDVLTFAETMISIQIAHFDYWLEEVAEGMWGRG